MRKIVGLSLSAVLVLGLGWIASAGAATPLVADPDDYSGLPGDDFIVSPASTGLVQLGLILYPIQEGPFDYSDAAFGEGDGQLESKASAVDGDARKAREYSVPR